MGRFSYVAVLGLILAGCLWLEIVLRTHVLARWRRLLITMAVPVIPFCAWDAYAIARGHWSFDEESILGIRLPGAIPVDELLFFLIIPLAAVLTLEAVRAVQGWPAGDEPPAAKEPGVTTGGSDG